MQGSKRKQDKDARRRAFHTSASRIAQPVAPPSNGTPQGLPPTAHQVPSLSPVLAVTPVETRPGVPRSTPPAQLQPHQAFSRGEPFTPGQPVYAPQANTLIPAPYFPPQETRFVEPAVQMDARPLVSVTVVLYSGGQAAHFTAQQFEALRRQTVQPEKILVHVDGAHGHDEKTLHRAIAVRTPVHFGRTHRLAIARAGATTKYVAILDEDTIPGTYWLERAITALEQAEAQGENPFGVAVVANAGVLLTSDDPFGGRPVGPEYPSVETIEVDYGRGGWIFRTDLIRVVESLPWVGVGRSAFSFAIAAAAHACGVPVIMLAYGQDQSDWGALRPSGFQDDPNDVLAAYQHYRASGWDPASISAASDHEDPSAQAQPAQPQTLPPVAQGVPSSGPAAPVGQPTFPPDATVTQHGGITQAVWTVPESERTAAPPSLQTLRTLTPEEETKPPEWMSTQRVLTPEETAADGGATPKPDAGSTPQP